jgi:hypothetical protein
VVEEMEERGTDMPSFASGAALTELRRLALDELREGAQ